MPETGSDTRSGIGARLRAGREKMGLTQLQAAEKLHVDPKVVDALEAERFDALGAPVFARGHLKHYAELIGEQTAQLHELYAAATQAAPPDLTKLPKAAPAANPSRLAVPALVVLIGFVLLGVVWWIVKSVSGSDAAQTRRGPQPVAIAPDVSQDTAIVEEPANESASSVAPANGAASTSPAGTSRGAPAAPGGASSGSNSVPAGTAAATTPVAAPSKPMQVTLRFAADSWVEVYDAKGEKLFYDVGAADSSRTVSGTPPFRVTIANAPGVTLDVNGKPAVVPANALKGDEAQFVINRSGRIVRARPPTDGG